MSDEIRDAHRRADAEWTRQVMAGVERAWEADDDLDPAALHKRDVQAPADVTPPIRAAEPLPGLATSQITDPKHVVRGTLAFFRTCIRTGEEYDETCERAYDRAMAALELLS